MTTGTFPCSFLGKIAKVPCARQFRICLKSRSQELLSFPLLVTALSVVVSFRGPSLRFAFLNRISNPAPLYFLGIKNGPFCPFIASLSFLPRPLFWIFPFHPLSSNVIDWRLCALQGECWTKNLYRIMNSWSLRSWQTDGSGEDGIVL